jgi:hypothetical protein
VGSYFDDYIDFLYYKTYRTETLEGGGAVGNPTDTRTPTWKAGRGCLVGQPESAWEVQVLRELQAMPRGLGRLPTSLVRQLVPVDEAAYAGRVFPSRLAGSNRESRAQSRPCRLVRSPRPLASADAEP